MCELLIYEDNITKSFLSFIQICLVEVNKVVFVWSMQEHVIEVMSFSLYYFNLQQNTKVK